MDAEDEKVVGRLRAKGVAILVAPAATMQCQNAASVMPTVHCVQVCAKAKFRHHHVNVMREIALDELGLGAAL
jgi:hypothetical protein